MFFIRRAIGFIFLNSLAISISSCLRQSDKLVTTPHSFKRTKSVWSYFVDLRLKKNKQVPTLAQPVMPDTRLLQKECEILPLLEEKKPENKATERMITQALNSSLKNREKSVQERLDELAIVFKKDKDSFKKTPEE